MSFSSSSSFRVALLAFVLFGCGRSLLLDGTTTNPAGGSTIPGTGGMAGKATGVGGALPGIGGALPGTGGARAGTGGALPGTGGTRPSTGGVGGAVPATGGATGAGGTTRVTLPDGSPPDATPPDIRSREVNIVDTRPPLPDLGRDSTSTTPARPVIGADGTITITTGNYVLVGGVASSAGGSGSSITLTYDSTSFCASGTVGANSTYQSWAQAGFAVNQPPTATGSPAQPISFSGNSITLAYTNPGASPLRIQLSDASYTYWCYQLDGSTSPVTIPLSSFNTKCWDNSGTPFVSGTQVQNINMLVPGSNTRTTPFSFCFNGLSIQ